MTKEQLLDVGRHRRGVVIAANIAMVPLAFWIAFALRFDFAVPPHEQHRFLITVPYLMALRLIALQRLGLFRAYWQHVGARDLVGLGTAVTLSSVLFVCVLFFTQQLQGMPRSVLILDWVLSIYLGGGIRFAVRFIWEGRVRARARVGKRTFVIGTGTSAEFLLRQAQHDLDCELDIVGLLDDDPTTHRRLLHGVPVLGATDQIAQLVKQYRAELIVISLQQASKEQMRALVDRCAQTGVEYKIVPSMSELLRGRGQLIGQLRDVRIEDLLGRQPVELDLESVSRSISGKVVLITGAAGSIGRELVRQVAAYRPSRLVLVEQAESALYFAHLDICRAHPTLEVVPVIADVTDRARIDHVFATYEPAYVFHAAAYKHVPMLERNAREAVRNNVFGTWEVAHAAARHGAERLLLISTDKAVNPSSVMGATKRIAERILLCAPLRGWKMDCRVVRFGNVLGSDGSVVPLFQRQLAAGLPLTVTHPDVRRYFMTIPEAVQLVLQASVLPDTANRIAMLEMGEPVRILDLAEQMIRLSGLRPYQDAKIVFTGLRPGEKLDEELMADVEATVPTPVEKIRVVQRGETDREALEEGLARLAVAIDRGVEADLLAEIRAIVPEYTGKRPVYSDVELPMRRVAGGPADTLDPLAVGSGVRATEDTHEVAGFGR